MDGSVESRVEGGVAAIEFGHPKSNSLPGAVLRKLGDEIAAAGKRSDVNVIALRSSGTGPFCAGASFDELIAIKDATMGKTFFLGFAHVIISMMRCPKPILTRVHGKVVGGGVGVVAASDYAIATNNAAIRLSELAVGIGPFVVGPVIERRIGSGKFSAMALDADWRSAEWARDAGLYAQLHASVTELDGAFDAFVAKMNASNPDATAGIKQRVWEGTDNWDKLLDARAEMSGKLVLSPFTRKAIEAFKAKG
ncbi:MAG TPA: enoyl-CoA hydratase/isomerase family protein [Gemmatimonadaceae bacterium]|nr:enoyl-CoA hydratase/isomerase family protein [Gemmatimonadaceae bacterium]